MTKRPPTPTGWSDTDWIKKLQYDEENPLACLHINQGSFDAAADAYEEEYKMSKRTALEIADSLQEIYYGKIVNESASLLRWQHAEIERLTAERDVATANASALTQHLTQVIGDHNAPSDCYSSGPMWGDARDAICPACEALRFLNNPRNQVAGMVSDRTKP